MDGLDTLSLPGKLASAQLARPRKAHYTFARRNPDHVTAVGSRRQPQSLDFTAVFVFSPKRSSDAVAGSAEAKQALSLPSSIG
jgi:hypothetical protein